MSSSKDNLLKLGLSAENIEILMKMFEEKETQAQAEAQARWEQEYHRALSESTSAQYVIDVLRNCCPLTHSQLEIKPSKLQPPQSSTTATPSWRRTQTIR
jgi:DNA-binding FadR family transcriptional regulator